MFYSEFRIGTPRADAGIKEIRTLLNEGVHFAVLTPITLIPEISRLPKDEQGNDRFDPIIMKKVDQLAKLVFADTAEAWLINHPDMEVKDAILQAPHVGCDDA